MKTTKFFVIATVLLFSAITQAQVSVNVNIGRPPAWAPVGYADAEYYYLPDVEAYYDVRQTQFIYYGNGRWMRSRYLPGQYRNYDLYGGYKVVLHDYHGAQPYNNFKSHKIKYYKGYKGNNKNRSDYMDNRRSGNDDYKGNDKHGQNKKKDKDHGRKD
ncbi:hypothetical protein SAMN05444372_103181 [Flavobacterium micromati]|uniref:YXWGXW repeat-containing protein n=1 Tax=Flavobacterium micromati TaxID=229205 RepID=A0A1M5HY24_9FLAO|nr:hypothetical protein [Flavobacterium micromati]SHG20773.1 hypothetical protein SAMN05444372_103181 [Flavobacterium micromati]